MLKMLNLIQVGEVLKRRFSRPKNIKLERAERKTTILPFAHASPPSPTTSPFPVLLAAQATPKPLSRSLYIFTSSSDSAFSL